MTKPEIERLIECIDDYVPRITLHDKSTGLEWAVCKVNDLYEFLRKYPTDEKNELLKAKTALLQARMHSDASIKAAVHEIGVYSASDILLSLKFESLVVWKADNGDVRVRYSNVDVKEGIVLKTVFGCGSTFESACQDYLEQIRGKTLVFNAGSSNRREVTVLG